MLIAGTTVVIGMLGLFVLREQLMNGVAIAACATVAMTMLASLTLLPALLGFTGTRLAKPSRIKPPRWLRSTRSRSAEPAYVTGPNAGGVSFANLIGARLPWLIGVVVALSMRMMAVPVLWNRSSTT